MLGRVAGVNDGTNPGPYDGLFLLRECPRALYDDIGLLAMGRIGKATHIDHAPIGLLCLIGFSIIVGIPPKAIPDENASVRTSL